MKNRITWIAPLRAATIGAAVSFAVSFPVVGLMHLFSSFAAKANRTPDPLAYVIFPVLFMVFGFIFWWVGAVAYNLIARISGGIEIDLTPEPDIHKSNERT